MTDEKQLQYIKDKTLFKKGIYTDSLFILNCCNCKECINAYGKRYGVIKIFDMNVLCDKCYEKYPAKENVVFI